MKDRKQAKVEEAKMTTDTARVIEVIETTLTRRGGGVEGPIRVVTQYWNKDGTLLAERDPSPGHIAKQKLNG
jgi:hypothetical protein